MAGTLTITLIVLVVLVGCAANVIFLEFLVKRDPGIGNLVTFCSFAFISLHGFFFTTRCGTIKPNVPMTAWTTMVIMYFIVSVVNNAALGFNISMPLHMIFRAGSLMANMILGMIILNKRYTKIKYLSVSIISIGIAVCTIASGRTVSSTKKQGTVSEEDVDPAIDFMWWMVGIAMLTFALFMSARMGIYQEVIYAKYGKHSKEALFYCHCLPLPFFLIIANNIYDHAMVSLSSEPLFQIGSIAMPSMIFYLFCNTGTQFICISAVYRLTSECPSLTVTLVVTLRKFFSLLFSIWYFNNPFTFVHWIGTAMVFAGTLLFSDIYGMIKTNRPEALKKFE